MKLFTVLFIFLFQSFSFGAGVFKYREGDMVYNTITHKAGLVTQKKGRGSKVPVSYIDKVGKSTLVSRAEAPTDLVEESSQPDQLPSFPKGVVKGALVLGPEDKIYKVRAIFKNGKINLEPLASPFGNKGALKALASTQVYEASDIKEVQKISFDSSCAPSKDHFCIGEKVKFTRQLSPPQVQNVNIKNIIGSKAVIVDGASNEIIADLSQLSCAPEYCDKKISDYKPEEITHIQTLLGESHETSEPPSSAAQ